MNIPDYLHDRVSEIIAIECNAAIDKERAEHRRASWAVIYNLTPFRDGNMWCVLLGEDIQRGIAGFGESPEIAIDKFDQAMRQTIQDEVSK